MADTKKWIVAYIAVDEKRLTTAGLPVNQELSSLPSLLDQAIENMGTAKALILKNVYLLNSEHKKLTSQFVELHSLNYHKYAVDKRGEACLCVSCKVHSNSNVIFIDDRRQRDEALS